MAEANESKREVAEDAIKCNIDGAICSSYEFLAREFGFGGDYYRRGADAMAIAEELWRDGTLVALRDRLVGLFEERGMDVEHDGSDF